MKFSKTDMHTAFEMGKNDVKMYEFENWLKVRL